jgi:hypothetical protein
MRIVSFVVTGLLFPLIASAQPKDIPARLKVGIIAPLSEKGDATLRRKGTLPFGERGRYCSVENL